MPYEFEFRGGIQKLSIHASVKFMLFFIVGGQEIPFYQMKRDGLVMQPTAREEYRYLTHHQVAKIFVGTNGYQSPVRFHSFYFKLMEVGPMVTILPFPEVMKFKNPSAGFNPSDKTSFNPMCHFSFKGKGTFLTKKQVLDLLDPEVPSRTFLKRQEMLPIDTLRAMVTIDRSVMRKGLRHVRIGK